MRRCVGRHKTMSATSGSCLYTSKTNHTVLWIIKTRRRVGISTLNRTLPHSSTNCIHLPAPANRGRQWLIVIDWITLEQPSVCGSILHVPSQESSKKTDRHLEAWHIYALSAGVQKCKRLAHHPREGKLQHGVIAQNQWFHLKKARKAFTLAAHWWFLRGIVLTRRGGRRHRKLSSSITSMCAESCHSVPSID